MSANPYLKDQSFPIPSQALGRAATEFRRLFPNGSFTIQSYGASAQELLAALVEYGWTIKPPPEAR